MISDAHSAHSEDSANPSAPRILCLAGSPRHHGNSEQLLDAFVSGVEGSGGIAVRRRAVDAGAAPCRGCNACSQTGKCVMRDGMDALFVDFDESDAVVVATPVFFATVPAVLKVVFDRCQPYWARRYVLREPFPSDKRPGAILVVGGGGDPFGTSCATIAVKSVFAVLGVSSETVFECVGPDAPGDIGNHPDALARAEQMGCDVVAQVLANR